MRREPALGALAGLFLAVALVAGVALAGGWSGHIDLVKTSTPSLPSGGASTSGTGSAVSPSTSGLTDETATSTSTPGGSSVFSVNGVASRGAPGLGELLLPIVLGAVLGLVFFGAYRRRLDRD